jgi:hypothetical protein
MTVVIPGEKSGEMSGANQYPSITFWARTKESAGVAMVTLPDPVLISANPGIRTIAEELVASGTVTGSDE